MLNSVAQAITTQTVIYPSNLYPGISWKIQPPAEINGSKYQYRQDTLLQSKELNAHQQWVGLQLNQPRYRPLDMMETTKPVYDYQYRSEIPVATLEQPHHFNEFKQGLSGYEDDTNHNLTQPLTHLDSTSLDYQNNPSQSNSNYRSQQYTEFKQGLPNYQPKPLPHTDYYSNLQGYSKPYPAQTYNSQSSYPQTSRYSTTDNNYTAQSYNPWSLQPQTPTNSNSQNPWQTSQHIYQNIPQVIPALPDTNLGLSTFPFDGQFHFQQDSPYNTHNNSKQPRELPFSPERVFIVPSSWIKPPTSYQSNTESGNRAQLTVYPIIEQINEQEVW
ncbi:MAG: hypothetical protein VSS52_001560 [Thiotrichaceae bacterium]|nr:hypothetical protein [Thiotrichaceae bacterium]